MTNEEAQKLFEQEVGDTDEQDQWQLDVIKTAFEKGVSEGWRRCQAMHDELKEMNG